jgi:hypothetical protein
MAGKPKALGGKLGSKAGKPKPKPKHKGKGKGKKK